MENFFDKFFSLISSDIRITTAVLIAVLTLALLAYRYFKNKEGQSHDDIL